MAERRLVTPEAWVRFPPHTPPRGEWRGYFGNHTTDCDRRKPTQSDAPPVSILAALSNIHRGTAPKTAARPRRPGGGGGREVGNRGLEPRGGHGDRRGEVGVTSVRAIDPPSRGRRFNPGTTSRPPRGPPVAQQHRPRRLILDGPVPFHRGRPHSRP